MGQEDHSQREGRVAEKGRYATFELNCYPSSMTLAGQAQMR